MAFLPKRCVVAPVDFSDESFEALRLARQLVDDPAHLHAIHVLPQFEPTEPGVIWSPIDETARESHTLQALRERLGEPEVQDLTFAVRFGDPGREIAAYAKEAGAELIVLPSHGRTGLSRLLIGSTAERVVRLAHCPVLVLRT